MRTESFLLGYESTLTDKTATTQCSIIEQLQKSLLHTKGLHFTVPLALLYCLCERIKILMQALSVAIVYR